MSYAIVKAAFESLFYAKERRFPPIFMHNFAQSCIFLHGLLANNSQIKFSMATTKVYLDTRSVNERGESPLKLVIVVDSRAAYLNLEVRLKAEQWDTVLCKVVGHPQRNALNEYIRQRKMEVDGILLKMKMSHESDMMSATELKNRVAAIIEGRPVEDTQGAFYKYFVKFTEGKRNKGTRGLYEATMRRMEAFDPSIRTRSFEDITREWLSDFDAFMAKTAPSPNARNIHLRNIRAVFNDALDEEVTVKYPFRKFKIRPVSTAKRSLTVEELRMLFDFKPEPHAVKYLHMFKLIFFLIGINMVDLCGLKEVKNGRIEYNRAKTHRLYSIKVEPEAMEIISRYKGKTRLLDIMDRYGDYKDYLKRMNRELQRMGRVERAGLGGKKVITPLFPKLSTYWARHTWATIAAELDIPKETIAAALGHGGNTVTDIYIRFDQRKVDAANRRVMDYVLYCRR